VTYEEWLNLIAYLKNTNDLDKINIFINTEKNENIKANLNPKIINFIYDKFNIAVNKIIRNIENIFIDSNELDLIMLNFRKDLNIIDKLIDNKQLEIKEKQEIRKNLSKEIDNIYNILLKEAIKQDPIGTYEIVIKNNRVKWSDNNEL